MSVDFIDTLDPLIERLRDDDLSEAEGRELAAILKKSPAAQQQFARQMALSAALHRRMPANTGKTVSFPASPAPSRRAWTRVPLGLAAAAVVILGAWFAFQALHKPGADELILASVNRLQGSARFENSAISTGEAIGSGTLRIEDATTLDLLFTNGASLLLEGPAEFVVESDMQVSLAQGQLAARIPEAAHGFTVLGPNSAVVDLGTEFSMAVDGDQSWVEVYEGEVELVLLNKSGQAWKNQSLTPTGPVRIDAPAGRIIDEAPSVELPRIIELPTAGLRVPKAYRESVSGDGATHYWRFEQEQDAVVADTLAGAAGTLESGIRLHKKAMLFPHGRKHQGAFFVAEPAPSLFDGEFTMEFWISPAFLQSSTVVEISHRDPQSKFREKLYRLSLSSSHPNPVYPPQSVRFLSELWPHGEKGALNVFSDQRYTQGSWHHVVAVRRADRIEIYLNGSLAQAAEAPQVGERSLPATITLGRLSGHPSPGSKPDRSHFKGLIDEFAVYPSALPRDAIIHHYRLMNEAR